MRAQGGGRIEATRTKLALPTAGFKASTFNVQPASCLNLATYILSVPRILIPFPRQITMAKIATRNVQRSFEQAVWEVDFALQKSGELLVLASQRREYVADVIQALVGLFVLFSQVPFVLTSFPNG